MRIKKVSQTTSTQAQVVDGYSTSTTDSYSCNYVNKLSNYSTEETVCGRWIDGKPIYRKVFMFAAMPNTTNKDIPHNISNLGTTIKCYGMAVRTSDSRALPIPDSTPGAEITCGVSNTNVYVITYSDRSSFNDSHIIIEYTKTTD